MNIPDSGIAGVPGSHHPQYIDVVHREHAVVETVGVRAAKAMDLRGLPSKTWQVNAGWIAAAIHRRRPRRLDPPPRARRRARTPRRRPGHRIWHLPAKQSAHARQKTLAISPDRGPGLKRS
jgi:hypothetical protein